MHPRPLHLAAVVLLLTFGPCGNRSPSNAAEVPESVAQWPPVTDRPALTQDEIARFIKANAVAEEMRARAEERFIAELPSYATPGVGARDPMGGIDLLAAMKESARLTTGIEADACTRVGVPYDEYRSVYKRLLQVNDLTLLQAKIDHKRRSIARLTEPSLAVVAREQLRAQRELEEREIQGDIAQLEKRRVNRVRLREDAARRKQRQLASRSERLPAQEDELRQRIGRLREMLTHERSVLAAHERGSIHRDAAEAAGGPPSDDRRAAQAQEVIAAKIARLEREIERLEQRRARLAAESHELEPATQPDTTTQTAEELELARQITARRQEAYALAEKIAGGGTDAEVAERVAQLRQRIEDERREVAGLEQALDTPAMRQAQRDYPTVMRNAASLKAFGNPIILQLPTAKLSHP
jgi:hypothetical protein